MNAAVDTQQAIYEQLCEYVDVLGAPVLAVNGILENGNCTCGKPDCAGVGKHPAANLCPRGVKDATTDKTIIKEWVRRGPHLNWAIGTGFPHPDGGYLLVIDVDPRNGGDVSLEDLETEHGVLPKTPNQITGGGGYHYLLRTEEQAGCSLLAPGLDIKSAGGYIMISPSLHKSGKQYIWDRSITDVPVAAAPVWVATAKKPKPRPPYTGKLAVDSIIGAAFEAAGWLGHETTEGRWTVYCPWASQHTDGRGKGGDSSTVILPPTAESTSGGFCCRHEHCKNKSWKDAMSALPVSAAIAARKKFEIVKDFGSTISNAAKVDGGLTPEELQELKEHLIFTKKKNDVWVLINEPANIIGLLNYDPRWRGVIAFDNFSHTVLTTREPPWHKLEKRGGVELPYPRAWTDEDDYRLYIWLTRYWGVKFAPEDCSRSVVTVAQSHGIHPVRSYLRSLEWDGVERLDSWLATYAGTANTPYAKAIGCWWMISAVARIMEPGCKADHVLILEGIQGAGKSTLFSVLAGPWFCDSTIELGNKDAYQVLKGRWIIELAELDSLNRADAARAKAFFTSPNDTYRPTYGRNVVTVPRQCVFCGTVNHSQFLRDETGNRRYWPILTGIMDIGRLYDDRDQLWAEALVKYESGVRWWPQGPDEDRMCTEEQQRREFSDEWELVISRWLAGPDVVALTKDPGYVSAADVLKMALVMEAKGWTTTDMMRVGRCMQRLGWVKFRPPGGNFWAFRKE